MDFDSFRNKFIESDRAITLEQYRALVLDELNQLIRDANLSRPDAGQARLFHPSSQQASGSLSELASIKMDFDSFRNKFIESDRAITLEQYRALVLDELNQLIRDANLSRPDAGQARLFHPSSQQASGSAGSGDRGPSESSGHVSKKQKVEIAFDQDGKFLDLSDVPPMLKLRSGLRKYLLVRDCYEPLLKDIVASLPIKNRKTVAILGTAGIGKSSLCLLCLQKLLDDPTLLLSKSRSFYFQTRPEKIWLYQHESGNQFSLRAVQVDEQLDESIIHFADMETEAGSPTAHAGISIIFTSFRPSRYKELTKMGWHMVMPTWSADEQADFFNSPYFVSEHGVDVAQRAYNNIPYFGGAIGKNIEAAQSVWGDDPTGEIEQAITEKGEVVCDRFFNAGFGGTEDMVSDVLVHRNPRMVEQKYQFSAKPFDYSFASPYVLRRLLQLKDNMLVTEARKKYSTGTFRGGDDANEFELLCLHGFKISGVEFLAQPLTDGARQKTVMFPPKQVLARNWREQENYLQANVLYIPPYGNLESGDSFCLIEIDAKWTVVILQCTIAEDHPVKQNGVKIIKDCYTTKSRLTVIDTVIMFMVPVNGKLKTRQPLVTQKGEVVVHETVWVSAQYKIENALVTADVLNK